ncbi:probable GTP-binding protein engB [Candidatus Vecturithrix granuli]|uniref:Probable GTP-binding protein EngB n=1 Tax=Vecturithrix granuli TaxID=1499967 RepID=A0A081C747_VECG1|nr:probable GTP-binding protein engB [Candidatus Vecturithrix granuli]
MKKFQNVHFIKSAVKPEQYPQHNLPEIAFIGRSNVGKSSLLNTLVNKKNLARISNTPGRTQQINFFHIDEKLCFVDLPGYGYAKVPESVRKQWKPMIESYLTQSQHLKGVVLIVDARHKPTQHDVLMREWLLSYQIPTIIVATKIDKIPKTKRQKQLNLIGDTLNVQATESFLTFSALTAEGVKTVWQAIAQITLPPNHDVKSE